MVMATPEEAVKRLRDGWIHSLLMIEVLAVNEEAAVQSLAQHVAKLEKEKQVLVVKKEFKEVRAIEKPLPTVERGYSTLVVLEVLTETFEKLAYLAMIYAPSSIEILHPTKITLDQGEAQGIVVSIAEMIHNFARSGMGGVVIRS